MARNKVQVTRTYAPIHFEDLDPHRFEDLIRELIYEFRDWQTIEATGRSGSDQGFDVRAFEKAATSPVQAADDDEALLEEPHPMDGRRWMIQGKREKELTPAGVKKILEDVSTDDPPYGYILAASAVFSKRSYDLFREVLRDRGVMEFHLWGRAELEDMLHQPKNDRILFTFFGISLVSRRRSRTTEIRTFVIVKNKLHKVLGAPDGDFIKTILIRDAGDTQYPYRSEYADFDDRPRWIERDAFDHHPLGFCIHCRRYFAYVDREKRDWDYTEAANLLWSQVITHEERTKQHDEIGAVRDVLKFSPRSRRGQFKIDGLIRYEDVLVVDADGDRLHRYPHVYVDFGEKGPIYAFLKELSVGDQVIVLDDTWKRIDFFEREIARPELEPVVRIRHDVSIELDPETLKSFLNHGADAETLYAIDERFDAFRERDLVKVAGTPAGKDAFLHVTHIFKGAFGGYLAWHQDKYSMRRVADRQVGREIADEDHVTILEVERHHLRDREGAGAGIDVPD